MNENATKFTKMHGLGNDFIVLDRCNQHFAISEFNIPLLANRHLGIGFDQLLVITHFENNQATCLIYNADGSEAEQCGNGLRCIARYLHETGATHNKEIKIKTIAGEYTATVHDYDHIAINMGRPKIIQNLQPLQGKLSHLAMTVINIGNPHAVITLKSLEPRLIQEITEQIADSKLFSGGINLGFMEIKNPGLVHLQTIERGTGPTLACGSNSCAAAVAGIHNEWLDNKVRVALTHGSLQIEWDGDHNELTLTGPASTVYSGSFINENLQLMQTEQNRQIAWE